MGTGQGGLEEPADELRLTVSFGFLENAVCVGTDSRPGDLEPRGGGGKAVSGDDFGENACLGGGQPEPCGKLLDLGTEAGGGIDDEDSDGRPLEVEDRQGPDWGERNDVGDKRRAIFASAKLDGSTGVDLSCFVTRPLLRERMQARGERGARGPSRPCSYRKPDSAPHEILGFGVGEDDPAIPGQEKNGETGGRDRRAERLRCLSGTRKELMERSRPLQMRRERFQEFPLLWFQRNRSGRSLKRQISGGNGRAEQDQCRRFRLVPAAHYYLTTDARLTIIAS